MNILMSEAILYKSKSANSFIKKPFFVDIREKTKFLDSVSPSAKFRLLCFIDELKEIPRCLQCGGNTSIEKSYKISFNSYCSDKCRKRAKNENESLLLRNSSWLSKKRIDEHLSIETIAKESHSSVTTVKKWMKIHQIPLNNYNKSSSQVTEILSAKDKLENLYKIHDIRTIADLIGSSNFVVWKALKEHNIKPKPSNSYPRTSNKVSSEEQELVDYISSIYSGTIITNDRTILNGKELDIYLPSENIAFEYNGLYWHNETKVGRNKHLTKTRDCDKVGVRLYHIFSDDWNMKNKVWKNRIKHILQLSTRRIFARKCQVDEITPQSKNKFLEENHLQGKDRSTFKYGLFYEQELVSVMTFSKARFTKHQTWELVRFASLANCSIVGGFSKILSRFRKDHPGSIVSYADMSYSDGGVYKKNGFQLGSSSGAGYKYTKDFKTREHRLNFTKSRLRKRFNNNFDDMTEKQICEGLGYIRVWDCGTSTYISN